MSPSPDAFLDSYPGGLAPPPSVGKAKAHLRTLHAFDRLACYGANHGSSLMQKSTMFTRYPRTSSSMAERITTFNCIICGKPVRLDECKVTDLGDPVHETCLAERIKQEERERSRLSAEQQKR